jgi:hypothetical protein
MQFVSVFFWRFGVLAQMMTSSMTSQNVLWWRSLKMFFGGAYVFFGGAYDDYL